MFKKLIFFNRWHNGDVFSAKGYIQDLVRQLPVLVTGIEISHAQVNPYKTMIDLGINHIPAEEVPSAVEDKFRFGHLGDAIYINTWIGAYGRDAMPDPEEHANYPSLYRMWMMIYDHLDEHFGIKLERTEDMARFIPTSDWIQWQIQGAFVFLGQRQKNVLICNGLVRSTQTNVGLMDDIVGQLAAEYKEHNFICTTRFDTTGLPHTDNIFFTDDINRACTNGDINEIAFLSTRCEVIVGKNSGPFMFCHIKENLFDANRAFVSLSHRASDSYCYGIKGLPGRYYHSSSDESPVVTAVIRRALDEKGPGPGEMIITDPRD
jgi:hypothetical protein